MRDCEISKEMSSLYFGRLAVYCLFEARVTESDTQPPSPVQCTTVHWTLRQILGLKLQTGRIHKAQNTTTPPCWSNNTWFLLRVLSFILWSHSQCPTMSVVTVWGSEPLRVIVTTEGPQRTAEGLPRGFIYSWGFVVWIHSAGFKVYSWGFTVYCTSGDTMLE
jgi:hypothetical protein